MMTILSAESLTIVIYFTGKTDIYCISLRVSYKKGACRLGKEIRIRFGEEINIEDRECLEGRR